MKLLEVAMEYAVSSIIPKGDRNRIAKGGILANSGEIETIAEKAKPVDQAENNPQITPNPGINIGNDIVVLCRKIPIASMSLTNFSNSDMNIVASSSLTIVIEPI
jgi:hypothetical protein